MLCALSVCAASFSILPNGNLTGQWQPTGEFSSHLHSAAALGALLFAAEQCDVADAAGHALEALSDMAETIDFTNPAIPGELPQQILDYGVHQAALGRMANETPWED